MLFKKKYKYIEMTHTVRDYEDFSVSLPTGDDREYLIALIRTLPFEKRTVHLLRINVLIRRIFNKIWRKLHEEWRHYSILSNPDLRPFYHILFLFLLFLYRVRAFDRTSNPNPNPNTAEIINLLCLNICSLPVYI